MLDKKASAKAIRRLVQRARAVQLDDLFRVLKTQSRMSVFRRLRGLGYLSSFTHAGGYYSLKDIPVFDAHGLWFYQGIGFSRAGTLKATLVSLVEGAGAGQTHGELKQIVRVRVQNTLLIALKEGLIRRERVDRGFLYVSADQKIAAQQVKKRREVLQQAQHTMPLISALVIEVLVEVIQTSEVIPEPAVVARGLSARHLPVSVKQVEMVYREHGLVAEKKTAGSKCSRS